MRVNRFFYQSDFNQQKIKIEDKDLVNQIKNVLCLKVGELVLLCDGNLNEAEATVVTINKNFIELEIKNRAQNKNEPSKNLILCCSLLKKENFELVVQKAVEIGVSQIIPLITARTVKLSFKKERIEKIIKEAFEQAGRGKLPSIEDALNFSKAVARFKSEGRNLFFDSSGNNDFNKKSDSNIVIWIGPEGGWVKEEIDLARGSGFEICSLGKLTLRAETSAIIASYIVLLN